MVMKGGNMCGELKKQITQGIAEYNISEIYA
jgi:hypothetical protein